MKELETIKQLKPHPHVIKLLGCVTESGELWLLKTFCIGNHMISSAICSTSKLSKHVITC